MLYSKSANKYYVSYTGEELTDRLRKHNTHHKGYTGKFRDWTIVYSETFSIKSEATQREKEIKGWKSRTKIEQLVKSIPT
ncbi:MAG: GIY-YIG nuclease family protein [Bacteroidia bacterium]